MKYFRDDEERPRETEFAKTMINNIGDGGDTSNTMDNGCMRIYFTKNFIQSDFNDFDVGRGEVP